MVVDGGDFGVQAHGFEDRREAVAEGDGAIFGVFTEPVRAADDLAAVDAAAGDEGTAHLRPMVPADFLLMQVK